MTKLFAYVQTLQGMIRDREEGQGLVEYALIISLVSIGAIVGLTAVDTSLDGVWTTITGAL